MTKNKRLKLEYAEALLLYATTTEQLKSITDRLGLNFMNVGHLLEDNSGIAVQFERVGYFFKDPDSTPDHFVFNKTTALKDSFKF